LGEHTPAIEDYRTVIVHPADIWTREAQRRLILLGTIYGQGKNIARDILRVGDRSSETTFVNAITPYARIIDPKSVATWLSGFTDVALAPLPMTLPPAVSSVVSPNVPQKNIPEPTPLAQTDGATATVAPSDALPSAATSAPPETFHTSTENLFLPPLRMVPNPEPDGIPTLESTFPGDPSVALLVERTALEQQYQREIEMKQGYNVGSWISLGTGVASTGTLAYFLYEAFSSYAKYQGATSAGQAQTMKGQTQFNSAMAITAGVVGGLALGSALMLQLFSPPTAITADRIRALDDAIDQLGKRPRS
jgi:hypothetical protein